MSYCNARCLFAHLVEHKAAGCKARQNDASAQTPPQQPPRPDHVYSIVGRMPDLERVKLLLEARHERQRQAARQVQTAKRVLDLHGLEAHVEAVKQMPCAAKFANIPNDLSYVERVATPTSLSEMARKSRRRRYTTLRDFVADCELLVSNTASFYGAAHPTTEDARATAAALLARVNGSTCGTCGHAARSACSVCLEGRCYQCGVCPCLTLLWQHDLADEAQPPVPTQPVAPTSDAWRTMLEPEPEPEALAALLESMPVEMTGSWVQLLHQNGYLSAERINNADTVELEVPAADVAMLYRRARLLTHVTGRPTRVHHK